MFLKHMDQALSYLLGARTRKTVFQLDQVNQTVSIRPPKICALVAKLGTIVFLRDANSVERMKLG